MRKGVFNICKMVGYSFLDNEIMSINLLSNKIDSNWKTTKNYVDLFVFLGLLEPIDVESVIPQGKVKYRLSKGSKITFMLRRIQNKELSKK